MRRLLELVALGVGLAAALRQRAEARAVASGRLRPLGAGGRAEREDAPGRVHRALRTWQPARSSSPVGAAAAALWAAPLTALGLTGALAGGTVPRWDDRHGALVAPGVRGIARWGLRAQSATAATLGQVVLHQPATISEALLAHEATHARQQERLGPLFAILYPVAGAVWGYRNNPFEVAARVAARAVD